MKRVVINGDGERLGTVTDDPFELTTASAAGEDFEAAFDGVAEATDADTAQPPVNPGQLAAELFTDESPRRRRELIRSVARANDWALVDPGGLRRADTEQLANRYQEGDVVSTLDSGVGVIAGAVAEDQTAPDDSDLPDIEASPDSPTYVVVTEDESQGMSLLKASDLESTEIEAEVDALDTTKEAAAMAELAPDDSDSEIAELDFTMPESWRESDTPARVIALKAFAGMGGSFDGCTREMRGAVSNPDAFCGSFLDEVLGYEAWRGDSPLPGD